MSELKDRIRQARKEAGYRSQESLADELGTTRDAIKTYELGNVVPNDVFLKLMAVKLGINEEWLRYGTGEMHVRTEKDVLTALSEQYHLDGSQRAVVEAFLSLTDEQRSAVVDAACAIADKVRAARHDALQAKLDKRERAHAELDQALDAEEKDAAASSSSGSASSTGSTEKRA